MEERFLIGYARVSTQEQELRLQLDALEKYGVPKNRIYTEKKSGRTLKNRKLWQLLQYLRTGDRIVVWRLDRLGRSLKELVQIVEIIEGAGADLVSLRDNIDTSTAGGRFYFHMMAAIAEFERNLISERTKAGMMAKQLADPGYKPGAKNKIADVPARLARVQELYDAGHVELRPKFKERGPRKGERAGYTLPMGKYPALMHELNKAAPDQTAIENTLTIARWLENEAPGLVIRAEDLIKDGGDESTAD